MKETEKSEGNREKLFIISWMNCETENEMDLTKYKDYTAEGFVNEEGFWLWVLENDENQQQFWQKFLKAYPEKQAEVEQAKQLVLEMNTVTNVLPAPKVDALWNNISKSSLESDLYQQN